MWTYIVLVFLFCLNMWNIWNMVSAPGPPPGGGPLRPGGWKIENAPKFEICNKIEHANILSDCPCKCLNTSSASGAVHDASLEYCGRYVRSLLRIQVGPVRYYGPVVHDKQFRADANCAGHIETEWLTLYYVNRMLHQFRQSTGVEPHAFLYLIPTRVVSWTICINHSSWRWPFKFFVLSSSWILRHVILDTIDFGGLWERSRRYWTLIIRIRSAFSKTMAALIF